MIKRILKTATILLKMDPKAVFLLKMDALDDAIEAILA
jgi:hypothetical protein